MSQQSDYVTIASMRVSYALTFALPMVWKFVAWAHRDKRARHRVGQKFPLQVEMSLHRYCTHLLIPGTVEVKYYTL